jgi:hypothetical protein
MIPAVSAAVSQQTPLAYQWVTAGGSGALYTSTSSTASTWTSRTSSFGTTNINKVAANGFLFVAVGDSGKLGTSYDGITWTQQTSSFLTSGIYSVAYGNGYWVAGGASKIATSTDGINWTQQTNPAAGNWQAVAYGNGLWVLLQANGTMYTATDPTGTWTVRTSTLANGAYDVHYAKAQSIWVAGADQAATTGALASSTDGLTWTARTSANTTKSFAWFASNSSVIICATSNATPTCDVQSSTNGTTWTDRTPASGVQYVYGAASDDAGLIAICAANTGGVIQTTSDGTTWTDRGAPAAGVSMTAICHSSGTPSIR